MKKILVLLLLVCLNKLHAQDKTLSKQLWEYVSDCYDAFDEDTPPDTIVDDTKNGYLHVEGEAPTCGCPCSSTVAAYKKHDQTYVFLSYHEEKCNFRRKVFSNYPLENILPKITIHDFLNTDYSPPKDTLATFILIPEIPQKGTLTKLILKQIPFGLNEPSSKAITYTYSGSDGKGITEYYHIGDLIRNITNEKTLELIVEKQYDKINNEDMNTLKTYVSESQNYKTIEKVSKDLSVKYNAYLLYRNLKYDTLILDFDKKKGVFNIKEKLLVNFNPSIRFKEFLSSSPWVFAAC